MLSACPRKRAGRRKAKTIRHQKETQITPSRGNEGLDEEVSEDDKKIVKTVHSMIENKVGVSTEQIKGLDEVVNKLSSKIELQF